MECHIPGIEKLISSKPKKWRQVSAWLHVTAGVAYLRAVHRLWGRHSSNIYFVLLRPGKRFLLPFLLRSWEVIDQELHQGGSL